MLGNLLLEALVAPAGAEVSVQSGGQCAHQPHRVHILAPPCACTHLRVHTCTICLTVAPTSEPIPPRSGHGLLPTQDKCTTSTFVPYLSF